MKREKLEQIIIEELVNEGLMDILKKPSRWLMTSDDEGTAALDKADASNVRSWNSRRKVEAVKNFKKFILRIKKNSINKGFLVYLFLKV